MGHLHRPREALGSGIRDRPNRHPHPNLPKYSGLVQKTLPSRNFIPEQRPVERRPLSLDCPFHMIWDNLDLQKPPRDPEKERHGGNIMTVTATQPGSVWARRVAAPSPSGRGDTYLQTFQILWALRPPQSPHSSFPRVGLVEFSVP